MADTQGCVEQLHVGTPAKWAGDTMYIPIHSADGDKVAHVWSRRGPSVPSDESLALSRLIAAAPELLAALAALVYRLERDNGWDQRDDGLADARAAIAKAKGGE